MTPTTMEAPAPEVGGVDAALDDIFNTMEAGEGEPAAVSENLPAGEAPTPEPGGGEPAQAPPGEGPASEYQLSEDGSHYLVPKDALGVLQTNQEYLKTVQEQFPTVADATEARALSSNWNQMRQDFLYNGAEGHQKMLDYLAGKNVDAQYPEIKAQFEQSFAALAPKYVEALESMAPETHRTVVNSLIQPYVNGLYQHAAETGDPAIFKAAQNVDWAFNAKYLSEPPKFDPNAARIQEQQQREQQITSREEALRDHEWSAINQSSVEGKKRADFNAELDRALAPFKDKYDPDSFADIRDGISRRLIAKLGEDKIWAKDHSNQFVMLQKSFETGWKPGKQVNQQAANAWNNDFMTRVRKYLPSIAEARLKSAPAKAAAPRTTRTPPTPARPTAAPARSENGQFTREQRDQAYQKEVAEATKLMGWG